MTNLCMTTREGVAIEDCDTDLKSVLLVDDEQSFLFSLLRRVKKTYDGLNMYTAANGLQARAILNTVPIDLVISDVTMPVMDGLELAHWLAEARPLVPAIIMSSSADPETIATVRSKGFLFLQKPLDVQDLTRVMKQLLNE
jgi:two-component system, response regulator YesN